MTWHDFMSTLDEIKKDIEQRLRDFPKGHYELSKLYNEQAKARLK